MKIQTKSLKFSSISTALMAVVFISLPQKALACATDPMLGTVCMTAASYCPRGYLNASGYLLPIAENTALYSVLRNTYGGDGRTNFGLPDLQGRSPVGTGTGKDKDKDKDLTSHKLGKKWGAEAIQLSVNQMPKHLHELKIKVSNDDIALPVKGSARIASSIAVSASDKPTENAVLGPVKQGVTGINVYSAQGTTADVTIGPDDAIKGVASGNVILEVTSSDIVVGDTGGVDKLSIEAPRQGLTFCVAYLGLYPQRS